MPYRILEYSIEIIRDVLDKTKLNICEYPRVIPIVLYTGDRKWNIKNEYASIVHNILDEFPKEINSLGVNVKYSLIDINEIDNNELMKENTLISKALLIEKSKTKEELLNILEHIVKIIKKKM